jgi:hypothetical protein
VVAVVVGTTVVVVVTGATVAVFVAVLEMRIQVNFRLTRPQTILTSETLITLPAFEHRAATISNACEGVTKLDAKQTTAMALTHLFPIF